MLHKINLPEAANELWLELQSIQDKMMDTPNADKRRFSVWEFEEFLTQRAIDIFNNLGLGLKRIRNFRGLESRTFFATMPHRDHTHNPCFAVNMCVQGSVDIHFYSDDDCVPFEIQQGPMAACNPLYRPRCMPKVTYTVHPGELFIMDTSSIHQADMSRWDQPAVLASAVPDPQYAYSEALTRLGVFCA